MLFSPRRLLDEFRRRADAAARDMWRDERAVSAVEFGLLSPVLLILLVGEFALGESISVSRKVAITGHAVVDLIARRSSVTEAQLATILNASAQIAAPFSTSDMVIVVAQLKTDASNRTTVDWSRSLHGDQLVAKSDFTLPRGVGQPGASLIYGAVQYNYRPPIGRFGAIPISYSIYMSPRITGSIPLK
jgi:Flp pilus assembly protein TadG